MAGKSVKIFDRDGVPQGVHINNEGDIVIRDGHNEAVHDGQIWYNANYALVSGAGTKKYFLFLSPAVENQSYPDNYFQIHMHWVVTSDAGFYMRVFYDPTITSKGDNLLIRNHNVWYVNNKRYSQLRVNPVFSDNGTEVWAQMIGAGKENQAGDQFTGEFILPGGYNYGVEFEKIASGDGILSWYWFFSEDIVGTERVLSVTTTTTV